MSLLVSTRLAPLARAACGGLVLGGAVAAVAVGCLELNRFDDPLERRPGELDAICTVTVIGVGDRDVEEDYLPHVIACENGGADFEALRAQAVSARSYMYYRMETAGEINDGTSDQVYTCGRPPSQVHYDAVASTAGEVLMYNDQVVAAFYVAGAIPGDRTGCEATGSDRDPTNTERFVTYNQGRSGSGLEQTTLGWVHPENWRNRGCKSQNGAHCLAEAGWNYRDIIRFYYGEDIQLVQSEGSCVEGGPVASCDTLIQGDETIVDDRSDCFRRTCQSGDWWWDHSQGHDGHSLTTFTVDADSADCSGRWTLDFEEGGTWELDAHLLDVAPLSAQARYRISHADGVDEVVIDQRGVQGWASLGSFDFGPDGDHWVELADNTGEAYTGENGTRLVFDAIRVRVPGADPDPPGEDTGVPPQEDTGPSTDSGGQDQGEDSGGGTTNNGSTNNGTTGGTNNGGSGGNNGAASNNGGGGVQPDLPQTGDEDTVEPLGSRTQSQEEGCAQAGHHAPLGSSGAGWVVLGLLGLAWLRRSGR